MTEATLERRLQDSLMREACLDVATFCLAVAKNVSDGKDGSAAIIRDVLTEWAQMTRAYLPQEADPFQAHHMRHALKKLV